MDKKIVYVNKYELLELLEKKIKADNERRMAVIDTDFIDLVNDATEINDVAPVVHGEWIKSKWGYPDRTLTCSVCGFEYDSTDYNTSKFEQKVLPHCPICTAKMDGGKE